MTNIFALRKAKSQLKSGVPEHRVWEALVDSLNYKSSQQNFVRQMAFARGIGLRVGPLLDHLIEQEKFLDSVSSEIRVALQGPKLTARIIYWLPWLALLGSEFLGLNTLNALLSTTLGWTILGAAVALGLAAGRSTRRILNRASLPIADIGEDYRLMAVALGSGVGLQRCFSALAALTSESLSELALFCSQALAGGLTLADQLLAHSVQLQESVVEAKRLGLEKLPIELLTPVGAFLLPQFMLLLVIPQVLAVISNFQN